MKLLRASVLLLLMACFRSELQGANKIEWHTNPDAPKTSTTNTAIDIRGTITLDDKWEIKKLYVEFWEDGAKVSLQLPVTFHSTNYKWVSVNDGPQSWGAYTQPKNNTFYNVTVTAELKNSQTMAEEKIRTKAARVKSN